VVWWFGPSGLVRSAESKGLYHEFKVGTSGLVISHLQYADDTLFIGEALMANPWALKRSLGVLSLLRASRLISSRVR